MLEPQTTPLGSSHTHMSAREACQFMCNINYSLSHMHGCPNWCHETSSTLFMDNWLNAVCHRLCHSHTLIFIPTILTCISLSHVCSFTTNHLTSSIHFSTILKENLYHLLMPIVCWYVQRSVAFLSNPTWSANANTQKRMVSKQMLDNIRLLPFYVAFKKMQTQHWLRQKITHLPGCSRKHALSIVTTHWCTNVKKDANHIGYSQKQCSKQHSLLSKEIQGRSIFKLSNKASYSTLWTHQKKCTQVPHPWCAPSPLENASNTNHFFGELTHSHDSKKSIPNYVHH